MLYLIGILVGFVFLVVVYQTYILIHLKRSVYEHREDFAAMNSDMQGEFVQLKGIISEMFNEQRQTLQTAIYQIREDFSKWFQEAGVVWSRHNDMLQTLNDTLQQLDVSLKDTIKESNNEHRQLIQMGMSQMREDYLKWFREASEIWSRHYDMLQKLKGAMEQLGTSLKDMITESYIEQKQLIETVTSRMKEDYSRWFNEAGTVWNEQMTMLQSLNGAMERMDVSLRNLMMETYNDHRQLIQHGLAQLKKDYHKYFREASEIWNHHFNMLQALSGALERLDISKKETITESHNEQNQLMQTALDRFGEHQQGWPQEVRVTWERQYHMLKTLQSVLERLDASLKWEETQKAEWLRMINEASSGGEAIEILEVALHKHPDFRPFMEQYVQQIKPFTQSENMFVRQRAIERLNRAARAYMDNCSAQDWPHAKQILDEVRAISQQFIEEREQSKLEEMEMALHHLETSVEKGADLQQEEMLKQLEEWDNKIDKRLLSRYPVLKERYRRVTRAIGQLLSAEQNNEALHQYNLRALQDIRKAYDLFQRNDNRLKQDEGIDQLAALLGGWDMGQLNPAVQTYYQSVYQEIFAKLEPRARVKLTEKVLAVNRKKVG